MNKINLVKKETKTKRQVFKEIEKIANGLEYTCEYVVTNYNFNPFDEWFNCEVEIQISLEGEYLGTVMIENYEIESEYYESEKFGEYVDFSNKKVKPRVKKVFDWLNQIFPLVTIQEGYIC